MADTVFITGPGLAPAAEERLTAAGLSLVRHDGPYDGASLARAMREIDPEALVVRYGDIDASVIGAGTSLKVIANHGAGYDNIDVAAATRLGQPVFAAKGRNAISVAEHALALMLMLLKRIGPLTDELRKGGWRPGGWQGRELHGARVGLVGCGAIGRALIGLLGPFGVDIRFFDPHLPESTAVAGARRVADLGALLAHSDILSLHVPATAETRSLLDAAKLRLLPAGALVINTARGGIIDEAALLALIDEGLIGGAGLDTFLEEPPAADSPLRTHPRFVATPHVAGVTEECVQRMSEACAVAVLHALRGLPMIEGDLVNPDCLGAAPARPMTETSNG